MSNLDHADHWKGKYEEVSFLIVSFKRDYLHTVDKLG